MDPVITNAPTAAVSNFRDHIAQADAGGDDAVPDHSPQVQDTPAPSDGAQPEIGSEEPTEPAPEQAEEVDETELLRKLKTELEQDALPEALHQKTVQVKIDGRVYDVPIAELAQGYQRASDYSRKMREVSEIRSHVEQIQGGAQRLMQDLTTSGESLLGAAKQLGFYKALVDAAKIIGRQRIAMQQLSPDAQQYALQLEEISMAHEAAQRRAQQLEERMRSFQQQQPDEAQMHMRHQLDQLVPRAFTKHKLGDYPLARDLFKSNLENLYDGGELTAALVDAAAQATAEQLADIAQRLPQGRPANGNGNGNGAQPLPPRRAAPANGKPTANGRKQGGTSSDFRAHLDRLNGDR